MTEIIQYPRGGVEAGPSLEDQLVTAWAVADRLAKMLVEAGRDRAWEAAGTEAELMQGPERTPAEIAESMGLIYTLQVALGITDQAGNPIAS